MKSYLTITLVLAFNIMFAAPQKMTINGQSKQTEKLNAIGVVKQLNSGERGDDITFGSEYNFCTHNINSCSAGTLDSNHFVVAYVNYYGYAAIGTISGDTITYGNSYMFNDGNVTGYTTDYITVAILDSTHFIITYSDRGDSYSDNGTAILGIITGDSISFSSEYVFNPYHTQFISATSLDEDHFVVAYDYHAGNGNYRGTSKMGTVTGNSLSFGSENIFNTNPTLEISATTLSESKIVISYLDKCYNASYDYKSIVGTVSGNTISYGSAAVSKYNFTQRHIATTAMDENHFVIAYHTSVMLGTISGNSISFGTGVLFSPNHYAEYLSIKALDSSKFILTYKQLSQGGGKAIVGSLSNSNIFLGHEEFFTQQTINVQSVTNLNPNKFVVTYNEFYPDDYGIGIIGSVIEKPVSATIANTDRCAGTDSILVPIIITDLQNVTDFSLVINYDTTNLSFVNCTNLNSQLNSGPLTATDNNGEITITWSSDTSAFILSDTLFELQFSISEIDSINTEGLMWDEANSYFQKSIGEFSECSFENGHIYTLVPEKPQGPAFIDLDNPLICYYTTDFLANVTSYQWFTEPPEATVYVSGNDTICTVAWNPNYTGLEASVYVIATSEECGPASSDTLVVSLSPVGLQNLSVNDLEFELFPNPGNGKFNLLFKNTVNNLSIKIIDTKKKKVHEEQLIIPNTNYLYQFDLSTCQSGVYFVQIVTQNSIVIKKLILK